MQIHDSTVPKKEDDEGGTHEGREVKAGAEIYVIVDI